MARELIVKVVGDATSYEKSLRTAARSTQKFGKEMDRSVRGVISGTGAIKSFGRSLAFASGGFLAFAGVSKFLTDSVSAAREAGVAQRSLAAQMKAAGESFSANREQVEKVATSYERFGFQNDQVVAGLTVLERGTGNLRKSMNLLQLTADIARAKNLDFSASAQILAKVFGGQETALRRAVPGLEKNAHGWDLIREAQAKMAGQAAANTTVSERFAATLHDTEEIIGTALLPILNKYLTSLSRWLQRMNESGRLQHDVSTAVRVFNDAIQATKTLLDPVITLFKALTSALHGTRNAVIALGAAWAGLKLASWAISIRAVGAAAGEAGAAREVGLLGQALGALGVSGAVGVGAIAAAGAAFLYMQQKAQAAAEAADQAAAHTAAAGSRVELTLVPNLAAQIQKMRAAGATMQGIITALRVKLSGSVKGSSIADQLIAEAFSYSSGSDKALQARVAKDTMERASSLVQTVLGAVNQAVGAVTGGDPSKGTAKRTVDQRNAFFDAMIGRKEDRIQDIPTLQGQIRAWEKVRALLQARLKITKDITRRYMLEGEIADVNRNIKGAQQQRAQNAKDAAAAEKQREQEAARRAKEAAQRAKAAAEAARAARAQASANKMQRKLDWAELALEKAQTTKSLKDDIRAQKVIIALMKEQIRQTGLTVDRARALFNAQQALRDLLHQGAKASGGGGGGGPALGAGAGFSGTGILPSFLMPAGSTGARNITPLGGGATVINGDVHMHGVQDVPGMEQELQKRAMARPQTRRGPV